MRDRRAVNHQKREALLDDIKQLVIELEHELLGEKRE